jgi:hypothetical protein
MGGFFLSVSVIFLVFLKWGFLPTNSITRFLVFGSFISRPFILHPSHQLLISSFSQISTFTMSHIQEQEWHHSGSSCCSPFGTCMLSWCCPCITYGRTHHRVKNDGNMQGYSCCNLSVSAPHYPRALQASMATPICPDPNTKTYISAQPSPVFPA